MPTGDMYRVKAVEFREKARDETNAELRAAFHQLVLAYMRLAEHADRYGLFSVETPPTPPTLEQQQLPQSTANGSEE
jgi:hypothetical protein